MIAISLENLGFTYRNKGDYNKSIECFEKLLEISSTTKDKKQEIKCVQTLSSLYFKTGQIKKCYETSYQAIQISKESNLPLNNFYLHRLKSLIEFAQKGKRQLILCFLLGIFAFPFALVWLIVMILWGKIRSKTHRHS